MGMEMTTSHGRQQLWDYHSCNIFFFNDVICNYHYYVSFRASEPVITVEGYNRMPTGRYLIWDQIARCHAAEEWRFADPSGTAGYRNEKWCLEDDFPHKVNHLLVSLLDLFRVYTLKEVLWIQISG